MGKKLLLILTLGTFSLFLINLQVFAQSSLIKNSITTIVGSGEGGGIEPAPIECTTTVAQCLKDEFNVILQGTYTNDERNDIYRILSKAGRYPKYRNLLKSSGPTPFVFVNDTSRGGGCPSRVRPLGGGRSEMTLYNYSLSDCSQSKRTSRIVHETGHVLRNGHMRLFQLFVSQGYNKDKGCYYYDAGDSDAHFSPPYFIKTYDTDFAKQEGVDAQGDNETMAEFLALTIVPEDQYPEKCPIGNRWVRGNIFGI